LQFDLGYWKAAKFVKDADDFRACEALIKGHFKELKHIFINLISSDNYPHIGWNDFVAFCRNVDILDGTLPTATVDRMFIATKVGAPKEGSGNTLFRHEFLEIMIRVANCKYRESGRADSYSGSLKIMLESIIPKFSCRPWQDFRDAELWTTKIDKLLEANKDSLRAVHDDLFPKYAEKGQCIRKCIDLMTKIPAISLSDKEARFCFGMSKMTVKDEVGNHDEYEKLRFAEFLEFFGRCAHARYIDEEELGLHEKIEELLRHVF